MFEDRVGDGRDEFVEAVIALEELPLAHAADAVADVGPAAAELLTAPRPEAAQVGVVVDDAGVVGFLARAGNAYRAAREDGGIAPGGGGGGGTDTAGRSGLRPRTIMRGTLVAGAT